MGISSLVHGEGRGIVCLRKEQRRWGESVLELDGLMLLGSLGTGEVGPPKANYLERWESGRVQ